MNLFSWQQKKRISEEIESYESILKRTQEEYMNNKKSINIHIMLEKYDQY